METLSDTPPHKTPRSIARALKDAQTTPETQPDPSSKMIDMRGGRLVLTPQESEVTLYPSGRILFSSGVTRWLRDLAWPGTRVGIGVPRKYDQMERPPEFCIHQTEMGDIITYDPEHQRCELQIHHLTRRLRGIWPSNEWTTRVHCTHDNSPAEIQNFNLIVIPSHPAALRRTSAKPRSVKMDPAARRARRPQKGDMYETRRGILRVIIDVQNAPRDEEATVTYRDQVEGSKVETKKLSYFREQVTAGMKLVEEGLL